MLTSSFVAVLIPLIEFGLIMSAPTMQSLPHKSKPLRNVTLEEIAEVLKEGLPSHFTNIYVDVVDCPDLTQAPFGLAAKGLGGKTALVEVGGPAYLLPLVQRNKVYNLTDLPGLTKIDPAFIIGAGAGPFRNENTNCEGIMNLVIENGKVNQQSRIAKITPDGPQVKILSNDVTEFGLLANLFVSEGKPEKVVKVNASTRIGTSDFIGSIRTTLSEHFGEQEVIGLGGTFLMKRGKAKFHIMPDFSKTPLNNEIDLNNWLQFFEFGSPMVAVGTFTTGEYDLDLRVQHFHAFSERNEGGHYHYDTTPDIVEYIGYFNVGEVIHRVDMPPVSQSFGKD